MHIREHLVLGLSGGERRIAYAFGTGDRVLTDAVAIEDPNRHKSADWLRLLECFGYAPQIETPRLRVSDAEQRWAADFLRSHGFSTTAAVVGVHPGASVPEKRWPLERFRDVVAEMAKRSNVRVLAFVDPQGYGASLGDIPGVTTAQVGLRELMALIQCCQLLVCNDSGPMHLAGALGVPTVAIFGTGIDLWFAPLGSGHRLITLEAARDGSSIRPYDVGDIPTSRVLHEIDASLVGQA